MINGIHLCLTYKNNIGILQNICLKQLSVITTHLGSRGFEPLYVKCKFTAKPTQLTP